MLRLADLALPVLWTVAFSAWPHLDIDVSGLAWNPDGGFVHRDNPWLHDLYRLVSLLTPLAAVALLLTSAMGKLLPGSRAGRHRRAATFLLLALLIGPGLIVNEGFKAHWGRARPREVQDFGGAASFTPALIPGQAAGPNGSFVSGHASAGFFLMAPALLMSCRRKRRRWILFGASTGLLVGLVRILQGAHFLSDVLFAGSLVWLSLRTCHWLFDRWLWPLAPQPQPPPTTVRPIQGLEAGT